MKTVADPRVLEALIARLNAVTPESRRRWGTLTPAEMLCHLGDAEEMVLGTRPRVAPVPHKRKFLLRWLFMWTPVPLPRGVRTGPLLDPRRDGTRPDDFGRDRERVIAGLRAIAAASDGSLEPAHGIFGLMNRADWQRWAWRHTDYHLRQFGA